MELISDNRIVLAEILQVLDYKLDFSLSSGWVLKENQKFGKKKGEVGIYFFLFFYFFFFCDYHIYFLAEDINKSEKYMA
ncbi:hypothetical protein RhiirA4_410636 [Rhizophagus irregularis]|uniref:Uncharacterized protein n=1 Tax=Rhizophagus irregularis TaxID=588596 RepID=A0A2I1H9N0_9GLOM|nr:hypothetical protein RhiirA4_410636 [Rhizophagus irregularis]